jgi:hypothetical protein
MEFLGQLLNFILGLFTSFFIGIFVNQKTKLFESKKIPVLIILLVLIIIYLSINIPKYLDSLAVKAEIVAPIESENVERSTDFYGTCKNLKNNKHLWIYVHAPKAGKYSEGRYFLDNINTSKKSNQWTKKNVFIGEIYQRQKETFKVGLIVVDKIKHDDLIKETRNNKQIQDEGREYLPKGYKVLDEIQIYREK